MTTALRHRVSALALLTVAAISLHLAGTLIEHPPILSAEAWTNPDLVAVTTSMVRWAALIACLWLSTLTVIDTVALVFRIHPLHRLVGSMVPAAWRTLVLRPVAIVSLVVPPVAVPIATALPVMAATAADNDAHTAAPVMTIAPLQGETRGLTLTMVHLGSSGPSSQSVADSAAIEVPPHRPAPAPGTWVVGPGENLWSISAAHLSEVLGHRPSSNEVNTYWLTVIDTNRHRLPDPSNPDLIYRGVELIMPPVS